MRNLSARLRLIHRAWRYRLRVERPEIAFLRRHLTRDQTALDIGACRGAFTYWMLKAVGAQGHVVAFEPIPQLAEYLRQLQVACRLERLTVVQTALSNTSGERSLFVPTGGHLGTATLLARSQGYRAVGVTTHTLDQFCHDHAVRPVHFIKCDVEGHELKVLQGGQRVLREDRPVLLVECVDSRPEVGQTDRVFPYLEALGYRGYFFPHGRTESLTRFRVECHQVAPDAEWLVNFGFLPKERV